MISKILMPMNLQFFAEDNPQGDPKEPVDPPKPVDPPEGKKQGEPADPDPDGKHVYTDEQVNEIVKKRLARAEKEKQDAVDEAAKLAKMNADQKTQYQIEKLTKELEEAKSTNAKFAMTKQAQTMFEEANTSVTSGDLEHVVTSDAESTKTNVQWLIDHDAKVREQVRQEFLKGTTPSVTGKTIKAYTQKEFDRMSYQEKADLAKNNPDEFKKLTGGL